MACVLAQNLDNWPALSDQRSTRPTGNSSRRFRTQQRAGCSQTRQGGYPSAGRVRKEDLVHVLANQTHARLLVTLSDCQFLPIRNGDGLASSVSLLDLTQALLFILRNNDEDLVVASEDSFSSWDDGSFHILQHAASNVATTRDASGSLSPFSDLMTSSMVPALTECSASSTSQRTFLSYRELSTPTDGENDAPRTSACTAFWYSVPNAFRSSTILSYRA